MSHEDERCDDAQAAFDRSVQETIRSGNSQIPLHGPDRTRTDKVRGLCRRPGYAARVSRKSPRGSGRARVVEFSLNAATGIAAVYCIYYSHGGTSRKLS